MDSFEEHMAKVRRYDEGVPLVTAGRTPEGFLKANARLTRTGVFLYRMDDGTVRREFRPPEEVFKPESLATFQMLPVTDNHPDAPVDPSNVRDLQRGHVGDSVGRDGDYMAAPMMVTDLDLAKRVESGEQAEVSNGYACDWDPTPGVDPVHGPYDGVQRNIVGNHVAIVRRGRAGPNVRVRLDAGDAQQVAPSGAPLTSGAKVMDKVPVTLMGVTFMVDPQIAQALKAELEKAGAEVNQAEQDAKAAQEQVAQAQQGMAAAQQACDAAKKDAADAKAALEKATAEKAEADKARADALATAEKEKARADSAVEAAKKAEQARADALEPGNLAKLADARAALLLQARAVLGSNFKGDGLTDHQVKVEVLKKRLPELKVEDKVPAYIEARFDSEMEAVAKEGNLQLRRDANPIPAPGSGEERSADEAFEAMKKRNEEAWKPKG